MPVAAAPIHKREYGSSVAAPMSSSCLPSQNVGGVGAAYTPPLTLQPPLQPYESLYT